MNQIVEVFMQPSPDTQAAAPKAANRTPQAAHLIEMREVDSAPPADSEPVLRSVSPLHQVKATLQVCVGAATLTLGELLAAREQQVLLLDRGVDQPVDLLLEGQVVARGQLVAVDDQFALRITELPVPLALGGKA